MRRSVIIIIILVILLIPLAWYLTLSFLQQDKLEPPLIAAPEATQETPSSDPAKESVPDEPEPAIPLEEPEEEIDYSLGGGEGEGGDTRSEFEKAMDELEDVVIEGEEDAPDESVILAIGVFIPANQQVSGTALFINSTNGTYIRFEDFSTPNGPGLRVYLSPGLTLDDAIDLGPNKITVGSVNYDIPDGTDIVHYNKVLIWSDPFSVLFGHAEVAS